MPLAALQHSVASSNRLIYGGEWGVFLGGCLVWCARAYSCWVVCCDTFLCFRLQRVKASAGRQAYDEVAAPGTQIVPVTTMPRCLRKIQPCRSLPLLPSQVRKRVLQMSYNRVLQQDGRVWLRRCVCVCTGQATGTYTPLCVRARACACVLSLSFKEKEATDQRGVTANFKGLDQRIVTTRERTHSGGKT